MVSYLSYCGKFCANALWCKDMVLWTVDRIHVCCAMLCSSKGQLDLLLGCKGAILHKIMLETMVVECTVG